VLKQQKLIQVDRDLISKISKIIVMDKDKLRYIIYEENDI
jgi:hypothetical protein